MTARKKTFKNTPGKSGTADKKAAAAAAVRNTATATATAATKSKPLPPYLTWLVPVILGLFLGLLHFDVKISEGNDDAMYIEAAWKYAQDYTGYFYTANAPLYPMLLGIVTIFSGLNLILFKAINLGLFILHLYLFWGAFRRRVPNAVLFPVLLLTSVNSYFLYYASQTYTEMLFITLQAGFLWVFFAGYERLVGSEAAAAAAAAVKDKQGSPVTDHTSIQSSPDGSDLLSAGRIQSSPDGSASQSRYNSRFSDNPIFIYFSIAIMLFLLSLCKNIAIGMVGAVILFLIIERRYRMAAYIAGAFVAVKLAFEGIKMAVWGAAGQYGSQGAILLQKNAYDASKGNEDVAGFINRFFGNFDLYLGKRLWQILGFRDSEANTTITFLAVFVLGLIIFAGFRIIKRYRLSGRGGTRPTAHGQRHTANGGSRITDHGSPVAGFHHPAQYLLLILLYLLIQHGLTFLVLQTSWDQPRLIMVYVPLVVLVVLYGFYDVLSGSGSGSSGSGSGSSGSSGGGTRPTAHGLQPTANGLTGLRAFAYYSIPVLIIGSSFITSAKKAAEHFPVMKKNMAGDIYYGYTPDWEHFLRLSAWCADSLPKEAVIASRKAPMSFVYGRGRTFFPVYSTVAVDSTTNLSYPDSALAYFRQNGVTHVILASLRRNPAKPDGNVINTLHRMVAPIARTYPDSVQLIKQLGTTEPAFLYKVGK
jgi:hypothetical protein